MPWIQFSAQPTLWTECRFEIERASLLVRAVVSVEPSPTLSLMLEGDWH
jgi:hypothetical protein